MHERKRGWYARLNASLRRALQACVVVVLVLVAGLLYVRTQVHDAIRAEVERRFAAHYPQFRVSIRSARLIEGRGVEIHGLSIVRPGDDVRLAYVDEIFSTCSVDVQQLLAGERPQSEHLLVRGLKLRAERDRQGKWSVQPLWPLPSFGGSTPPITLKDASLEACRRQRRAGDDAGPAEHRG